MRAQEKCYNLKEKNLVKYGYGLIEELVKSYEKYNEKPMYTAFTPYKICPLGAHVDHNLGLVTGFAT